MAEKRGRRSLSLSLDMKSPKRRCLSASSLDSDDDGESCIGRSSDEEYSDWSSSDLKAVGVYYNDLHTPIADLFSFVEKCCYRKICGVPEIIKLLIKSTKDFFQLSLLEFPDFSKRVDIYRCMDMINDSSKVILSQVQDVESRFSFEDNDDSIHRKLTMFYKWKTNLEEFITELKTIMHKIANIDDIKQMDYQWMFMKFSEIFLMKPQPGGIFPREMTIKGQTVTCTTDIRYVCHPSVVLGSSCMIVNVTENNHLDADAECDIKRIIPASVLGQIGAELLFENKHSAFYPGSLGLLCLRTKLIFMYCETTKQHLQSLKSEPDGHSVIYYTKAYDYMIASDRNEIIDYLFWIGCYQSLQDHHFHEQNISI